MSIAMPRAGRAFTLIELLVVISIIVILAGILLPAAMMARTSARITTTTQRMSAVISALQSYASEIGSCFAIQKRLSADTSNGQSGYPLWASGSTDGTASGTYWYTAVPAVGSAPTCKLSDLNPCRSNDLLNIAGVLVATDYTSSTPLDYSMRARGGKYPWNDAWGNPLVVAYGLWQPVNHGDRATALDRFHYNRALYVSVGIVGNFKPTNIASTTTSDWVSTSSNAVFTEIWAKSLNVCGAPNSNWDWTNPTWVDIKRGRSSGFIGLVSAPVEIR